MVLRHTISPAINFLGKVLTKILNTYKERKIPLWPFSGIAWWQWQHLEWRSIALWYRGSCMYSSHTWTSRGQGVSTRSQWHHFCKSGWSLFSVSRKNSLQTRPYRWAGSVHTATLAAISSCQALQIHFPSAHTKLRLREEIGQHSMLRNEKTSTQTWTPNPAVFCYPALPLS